MRIFTLSLIFQKFYCLYSKKQYNQNKYGKYSIAFATAGWKPAGRRRFIGSVHDSPGSRQGSRQSGSAHQTAERDIAVNIQHHNNIDNRRYYQQKKYPPGKITLATYQ